MNDLRSSSAGAAAAITGLQDTYTVWLREMQRYRRNYWYLFAQLAFPLLLIVLIALPIGSFVPDGFLEARMGRSFSYAQFLANGLLVFMIAQGAFGAGTNLIQDRVKGFLREILIAPVSRLSIILGKTAARVTISGAQTFLVILILVLIAGAEVRNPLLLGLSIVYVAVTFVSLGIIGATVLMDVESYEIITGLAMMPIFLLSGAFFPLAGLPAVLRVLGRVNPLHYGVDLFRHAAAGFGENAVGENLLILTAVAVGLFLIAVLVFDRRSRN